MLPHMLEAKNAGKIIKVSYFQITLPENTTHIVICTSGDAATQSADSKREVIKTVVKAAVTNNNQQGWIFHLATQLLYLKNEL